jgi:hypothetical protein
MSKDMAGPRKRHTGKFSFKRFSEERKLGLLKGLEDICRRDCLFTGVHGVFIGADSQLVIFS